MTDYAVTLTNTVAGVLTEQMLDTFIEQLPDDAAVAVTMGIEMSVTFAMTAENPVSALVDAAELLHEASDFAAVYFARPVEVSALEWEIHEQRMNESNMPDLVSAPEVGAILGVTRQRVHKMLSDRRLPPPILKLGSGPLWLRSTIEEFDRVWPRRVGRPPTSQEFKDNLVAAIAGPDTKIGRIAADRNANIERVAKR